MGWRAEIARDEAEREDARSALAAMHPLRRYWFLGSRYVLFGFIVLLAVNFVAHGRLLPWLLSR